MTIPAKMRAVQLVGHGGPEMLELREVAVPEVRRGEVLVRVAAAAVNNTDINTRIGWYSKGDNDAADASWTGTALPLPLIQGADVCGYIAAVGEGVEPDRVGERVLIEPSLTEIAGERLETPWYFGSECDGGFAQYTRVASRHAHQVDSALSDVELASFPCSYSTAENMLTRAAVGRGTTTVQEYWAEGSQFWFNSNRLQAFDGRQILNHTDLAAYDPQLYAVLEAAYGENHRLQSDPFHMHPARVPPGPLPENTAEVC